MQLTEEEIEIVDQRMNDHMYGHQISNNVNGMSCSYPCRTSSLQMFVNNVLIDRFKDMEFPLFGGWTPTYEGDPCQGGHPPQSISEKKLLEGRWSCGRCGRLVDMRNCLCGEPGHRHGLARSMCPIRMRFDKRDAETFKDLLT